MPPIPSLGDIGDWRLSKVKVGKEFTAWDGLTPTDRNWVTRVHDHAQSVNPNWRRVLDHIRMCKQMLTWFNLRSMKIDGLNPADLASLSLDLWTFIGSVVKDEYLPRRQAQAAGEEGNGFELWRSIYWEHEGGSQTVQLQGVRHCMAFPRAKTRRTCTSTLANGLSSATPMGLGYLQRTCGRCS